MARSFMCPHCGAGIIVKYLTAGEPAHCRSCGNSTPVPESTRETDADPSYTRPGSAPRPTAPVGTEVSAYMPMTVGGVWGTALSVYGRDFIKLVAIVGIFYAPLILYEGSVIFARTTPSSQVGMGSSDLGIFDLRWFITTLLGLLFQLLANAAVVYAVFQSLRGRDPSIAGSISVSLSRIFPVLGVTILTTLAIGLGYLLLVIPGIIISVVLYVAVPPVVVEKAGIGEAISRSIELTKGRRWSIFGIVILIGILTSIIPFILGIILVAILGASSQEHPIGFFITQALTVVLAALNSVIVSTVYHDLRVEKEGIDTEALAAVFD